MAETSSTSAVRAWITAPGGLSRWGDAAVGAVLEASGAAGAALGGLRRSAEDQRRLAASAGAGLRRRLMALVPGSATPAPEFEVRDAVPLNGSSPTVPAESAFAGLPESASFGELVDRRVAGLAERGAAERRYAQRRAQAAFDDAVTAVAGSALVARVVDVQVERLLRPLVQTVLADVLAQLEREPDRIHALVRGQRDTMVDEVVGRIRTGAASGDATVDRLTARLLRRGREPVPGPPFDLP
jgi:hypothetical protein